MEDLAMLLYSTLTPNKLSGLTNGTGSFIQDTHIHDFDDNRQNQQQQQPPT